MAASFRGGLPLFAFKGIQVRVHWSFLALPAFIIISVWLTVFPGRAYFNRSDSY